MSVTVVWKQLAATAAAVVLGFTALPVAAADEDILDVVRQIGHAYRDADVETLDRLVTESYVHTNSSSPPIGKDAWLRWVESRRQALDEGRLRVLEYETDELQVVRHGDAAIVTGRNRAVAEEDGARKESAIRFTMVFVREGGAWKRAAFQDCRVTE